MKAIIVGAGAAGLLHALAYRAAGIGIAAVYDPDPARRRALTEVVGGRASGSLEEALEDDAPFVSICSPPRVHAAQVDAVAGRGLVFVEKPVAVSLDGLARLAEEQSAVPVVQWRAGRALRALRRAIAHGELGYAPTASLDLAWARDAAYFTARPDWGCGALLSIGIHAVDAIVWAFGDAVADATVFASGDGGPGHGETCAVMALRFVRGGLATIRVALDGGDDATRITVCGRGVTARIEGGEADPTGSVVTWVTADDAAHARLVALEKDTPGALGSPLLVPFMGDAIRAYRAGARPGEVAALPDVASTFAAHAAAIARSDRYDARR